MKTYRVKPAMANAYGLICAAALELARSAAQQFAKLRRNRPAASAILCLATLPLSMGVTGCMVGPNYRGPSADVADAWLDIKTPKQEPVAENGRWWRTFNDAMLTALIDRALGQNLTLRQAGLRVIQARALRGIAVGEFFPQSQTATGQVTNNRVSKNSPVGLGDRSYKFGVRG